MNEEIKKKIKYMRELHYGASITGDEYEEELVNLYKEGANDMWSEIVCAMAESFQKTKLKSDNISYVKALRSATTKAQQFIESLEGKDGKNRK